MRVRSGVFYSKQQDRDIVMSSVINVAVGVFKYNNIVSLYRMSSPTLLKQFVSNVINDLLHRTNVSLLRILSVTPGLLEQYNVRYTEKWVRRIDENFLEYNVGIRPRLNIPLTPPPRNLKYLSEKFFSGDISGTIAESLFIYLLDELGVDISLVGHLRPLKKKRAFLPDFVIWDDSHAIRLLISSSNYQPPAYAEVKGSTSNIDPNRLIKALLQLNKLLTKPSNCGIVFFAFKNLQNLSYEALILEVIT